MFKMSMKLDGSEACRILDTTDGTVYIRRASWAPNLIIVRYTFSDITKYSYVVTNDSSYQIIRFCNSINKIDLTANDWEIGTLGDFIAKEASGYYINDTLFNTVSNSLLYTTEQYKTFNDVIKRGEEFLFKRNDFYYGGS